MQDIYNLVANRLSNSLVNKDNRKNYLQEARNKFTFLDSYHFKYIALTKIISNGKVK